MVYRNLMHSKMLCSDWVSRIICCVVYFFFFKQKTAYEMRISDWSSDVCSSDLHHAGLHKIVQFYAGRQPGYQLQGQAANQRSVLSDKEVFGARHAASSKHTVKTHNKTAYCRLEHPYAEEGSAHHWLVYSPN